MNREEIQRTWQQKGLGAICVSVLCAILAVALWPFNPYPKNRVTWLHDENGISFGGRGVIWSSGTFGLSDPQEMAGGSLELWLNPRRIMNRPKLLAYLSHKGQSQSR